MPHPCAFCAQGWDSTTPFFLGFSAECPVAGGPVPQVRVRSVDANLGDDRTTDQATLADALHFLKLSFPKHLPQHRSNRFLLAETQPQRARRRRVKVKLRYLHRNPAKRGLVTNPADWTWSSFLSLRPAGSGTGGDRVGVDRFRSANQDPCWPPEPVSKPRLASKARTRTPSIRQRVDMGTSYCSH